jgi:hypothetical protein
MGFDLAANNLSVKCEEGYEFELTMPGTGKPTGAFIKVRGDQSKPVRAYIRKKYTEMQTRQRLAAKRNKDDDYTLEEAEELAVEAAVVRIISWKGLQEGNKDIVFSVEEATRILTEHSWIREQVMEAATDITNFQ